MELNKFELMLKLKQIYQNFRHVCIHIFNNSWKFLKYYFKLRLYSIIMCVITVICKSNFKNDGIEDKQFSLNTFVE